MDDFFMDDRETTEIKFSYDQNQEWYQTNLIYEHLERLGYVVVSHRFENCEMIVKVYE